VVLDSKIHIQAKFLIVKGLLNFLKNSPNSYTVLSFNGKRATYLINELNRTMKSGVELEIYLWGAGQD